MNTIKIKFLILLFFQCTVVYSAHANIEYHQEIENQAKDLESLVGRSFAWENRKNLKIHNTNSKGQTVGEAYFTNSDGSIGNPENVAWYWHPGQGFSIIISQNELLDIYEKDHRKSFQFYEMSINESGIVVFSFLVDQRGYNVCPWLWWSLDEGIHLSEEPTSYQLVTKLNDNGYVLIKEFLQHPSFKLHIKSLGDRGNLHSYEFEPRSELIPYNSNTGSGLLPGLEKDLVEIVKKYKNINTQKILHITWGSFIVDEFADNLNIKGHGRIIARLKTFFLYTDIRYEIHDGKARFLVEKITEAYVIGPKRFTDIDDKVIFEKNFFN